MDAPQPEPEECQHREGSLVEKELLQRLLLIKLCSWLGFFFPANLFVVLNKLFILDPVPVFLVRQMW